MINIEIKQLDKNIKQLIISNKYSMIIPEDVEIEINKEGNECVIKGESNDKKGLLNAKLNNIIKGLTVGHTRSMTLTGVGYWVRQPEDSKIEINIGYKDAIVKYVPKGIDIEIKGQEGKNELVGRSKDLELLTLWMSGIRQLKPAYKNKYLKDKGWSELRTINA